MRALQFSSAYRSGQAPYDIFKDRVTAINSITTGIKELITNRYYKQLNEEMIKGLGKKLSGDQVAEKLSFFEGEPDPSIYPSKEVMEDTVGQFVDYTMRQGGAGTPTEPTEEVMIPGMNKQQLLDHVMAGGEMDWSSMLKVMEKRPGFLGEYSPLERAAIEGVLGKDVMGEKIEAMGKADIVSKFFEPPEKKIATTELEFAQMDIEGFIEYKKLQEELDITTAQKNMETYVGMYNRKEVTYDTFLKLIGGYIAPKELSDFERKLKLLTDSGMWETMSEDNKLKFFGAYIKPEEEPEAKKSMYEAALTGSEDYFGIEDFIYIDREGFVKDEDQYRLLYAEYERGAKEHYETTGEILSKDYLSLEEAGKFALPTLGTGVMGGFKPVLNAENIPWGWLTEGKGTEKKAEGAKDKEDESGYIVRATYKDKEGKLFKYLGDNQWEEVSPGEKGRKRGVE